ncbi:hypothetical protein VK792_10235 [Mesobacterium sp. TK19101]|uniref:Uncharacterized protein n=1 Tax=Mesobacterium hydrothermale TaxID=3111907 RepID=A0ABU6HGS6_9RHOB|nr:hypothetical protein [Mesobacterium sp. TK19101]MEC3861663.1 hypothetical protein [Mesobacterium sp. TK19101]
MMRRGVLARAAIGLTGGFVLGQIALFFATEQARRAIAAHLAIFDHQITAFMSVLF